MRGVCVYHVNRCKTSYGFSLICRGWMHGLEVIHQRRHCLSMVISIWDARSTYLPTVSEMGRGSTQEPPCRPFETSIYCTAVAIWNQFWSFTISSAASEPSSVFSPKPCRRQYFGIFGLFRWSCRRCIWIFLSHITSPMHIFFDDDLGHGNHSGELLLFVGCIVNFVVSYLICMFQDSVPAGSYNDPFLSSVIPMVTPTWCHRANWGNPF